MMDMCEYLEGENLISDLYNLWALIVSCESCISCHFICFMQIEHAQF